MTGKMNFPLEAFLTRLQGRRGFSAKIAIFSTNHSTSKQHPWEEEYDRKPFAKVKSFLMDKLNIKLNQSDHFKF